MTVYNPPTDAELGIEKPILSSVNIRLRDMAIAITEGTSPAPQVQTAAIADEAITQTKLVAPTGAGTYLIRRIQEAAVSSPVSAYPDPLLHDRYSSSQHLGCTVLVPGTIRAYMEHKTGGATAYVRVLKNGSQVQEWPNTSTSFVARTVDIAVSAGDVIVFQQTTGGPASIWRYLRIYSGTQSMAVA